jgi:hypothetical protein
MAMDPFQKLRWATETHAVSNAIRSAQIALSVDSFSNPGSVSMGRHTAATAHANAGIDERP